jgi:hypothetical protein
MTRLNPKDSAMLCLRAERLSVFAATLWNTKCCPPSVNGTALQDGYASKPDGEYGEHGEYDEYGEQKTRAYTFYDVP